MLIYVVSFEVQKCLIIKSIQFGVPDDVISNHPKSYKSFKPHGPFRRKRFTRKGLGINSALKKSRAS